MKPILHALWSPDAGSGSEGELLLWAEGLPRRAGGPGGERYRERAIAEHALVRRKAAVMEPSTIAARRHARRATSRE